MTETIVLTGFVLEAVCRQVLLNIDNFDEITKGSFRRKVEEKLGVSLSERKSEVNDVLEKLMQEIPDPSVSANANNHNVNKGAEKRPKSSSSSSNSSSSSSSSSSNKKSKKYISNEYVNEDGGFDSDSDVDPDEAYAKKLQAMENSQRRRQTTVASTKKSDKKAKKKKSKDDDEPSKPKNFRPMYCSEELTAVIGVFAAPRTQATKLIWDYIRKHNLQDPENKRNILCDSTLKKVLREDVVSMFHIAKSLGEHLTKIPDEELEGVKARLAKLASEP